MLELVDVGPRTLQTYRGVAPDVILDDLGRRAAPLRDARVLHLNATPYGGGVSELLRSGVPLLQVTKKIHNGLQGAAGDLTETEREAYLGTSRRNAELLTEEYDFVFLHDPQPAGILSLRGKGSARWIWRCHIDTAQPNPSAWAFLHDYLEPFDAAVFTMEAFVPPAFPIARVEIMRAGTNSCGSHAIMWAVPPPPVMMRRAWRSGDDGWRSGQTVRFRLLNIMFKHILIPTDGSPLADKAVKAGIRFAHEIGAKVTAYSAIEDVLGDVRDDAFAIEPKMHDDFIRKAREAADTRLDAFGKLAKRAGVAFDAAVTVVDTPYKGIIAAAKKHKCDVIFIASHGRRGVSGLLLGSVTHKVLTHCTIPVLVYR